jgi:hypothetical protein
VLVNKVVPKDISSQLNNPRDMPADAYRPQPLIFKEKADAYIDQLIMTSNADDYFVIKVCAFKVNCNLYSSALSAD